MGLPPAMQNIFYLIGVNLWLGLSWIYDQIYQLKKWKKGKCPEIILNALRNDRRKSLIMVITLPLDNLSLHSFLKNFKPPSDKLSSCIPTCSGCLIAKKSCISFIHGANIDQGPE